MIDTLLLLGGLVFLPDDQLADVCARPALAASPAIGGLCDRLVCRTFLGVTKW